MNPDDFTAQLAQEGFTTVTTVTREPNGSLDEHAHPFEAKALILSGEIRIRCGTEERRYGVGDVFHLAPNVPHTESYGPEGVSYLAGRK